MPCLVLCGHPSVGKTTLAELIRQRALLNHSASLDSVIVINEESACPRQTKAECYANPLTEKKTRGALKACFDKAVNSSSSSSSGKQQRRRRHLVLLDSMNYIKGFRYELHLISKAAGEQHGVLWVLNSPETAKAWNQQRREQQQQEGDGGFYGDALMDELMLRFEPPDERNRWDQPLYKIDLRPTACTSTENEEQQLLLSTSSTTTSSGGVATTAIDKHPSGAIVTAEGVILQQSVYNMHKLRDVMGTASLEQSSGTATSQNDAAATAAAMSTTKKKTTFAGFKRAPKTVTPTASTATIMVMDNNGSQDNGHGTSQSSNEVLLYPSNFLLSADPSAASNILCSPSNNDTTSSNSAVSHNSSNIHDHDMNTQGLRQQQSQPRFKHKQRNKTDKNRADAVKLPSATTLEERIDAILDAFLLHVQPLKEGMSTQINVAGNANILHDLDAITNTVCLAIVDAQQTHGGNSAGRIPIVLPSEQDNGSAKKNVKEQSLFLTTARPLPLAELRRLRRQYLRWVTTHPPDDTSNEQAMAKGFLLYIEAQQQQ